MSWYRVGVQGVRVALGGAESMWGLLYLKLYVICYSRKFPLVKGWKNGIG